MGFRLLFLRCSTTGAALRDDGIEIPPADRVFQSIGSWRGLADANVQQIISARTYLSLQVEANVYPRKNLQKTQTADAAPTRPEHVGGSSLFYIEAGKLHVLRYRIL